jgi:hypothetical protein
MNSCPSLTPRCRHCGEQLEHFEGEPYCPDCTSYTVSVDVVDLALSDDLIDLARDD